MLPIGAHLDGMITNETLVMLMSAAVLVAAPAAIAAAREGRVAPVAGLALLLGLAVMSKVSALVLVISIAAAIGLEIARAGASWWQALRARLRPLVAGTLVLAVVAGPFFARNVALYGQVGADRLRRFRQGEPGVVREDPVPRAPPARLLPRLAPAGYTGVRSSRPA